MPRLIFRLSNGLRDYVTQLMEYRDEKSLSHTMRTIVKEHKHGIGINNGFSKAENNTQDRAQRDFQLKKKKGKWISYTAAKKKPV